jgi:hypothetical protein
VELRLLLVLLSTVICNSKRVLETLLLISGSGRRAAEEELLGQVGGNALAGAD